jgi:hypothetical protein
MSVTPGTYRIVNVSSDTAIAIPPTEYWGVAGWHKEDNISQQVWIVKAENKVEV